MPSSCKRTSKNGGGEARSKSARFQRPTKEVHRSKERASTSRNYETSEPESGRDHTHHSTNLSSMKFDSVFISSLSDTATKCSTKSEKYQGKMKVYSYLRYSLAWCNIAITAAKKKKSARSESKAKVRELFVVLKASINTPAVKGYGKNSMEQKQDIKRKVRILTLPFSINFVLFCLQSKLSPKGKLVFNVLQMGSTKIQVNTPKRCRMQHYTHHGKQVREEKSKNQNSVLFRDTEQCFQILTKINYIDVFIASQTLYPFCRTLTFKKPDELKRRNGT